MLQRAAAEVDGLVVELLFDPQQLVVLRNPIGPRRGTGLDLAASGRYGEVGDRCVFGLTRTVAALPVREIQHAMDHASRGNRPPVAGITAA